MPNSSDPVELVLHDSAKEAVAKIASLLGNRAEEEAVYRALGTELYLLQRVSKGDKVYLQSPQGVKVEVDLI
jgi:hypothetical protein